MSTKASPKSANSDRRSKKRSDRKRRSDITKPTKPEPAPPPLTADLGDDFVPFVFSDSEEEPQEANPVAEEGPPQRECDKDKKRADKKRGAYDANDGYANKKQRLDAASRRCPWVLDVEWEKCNNVAEMLHKEVTAFIEFLSPTPEEHEVRGLIIALISKTISATFPDAIVLPFGSYETKLYLPLGDIDLVITSESMAYSDKVNVLHAVASSIRKSGIADKVTIIAKAKVPIVKFVTTHGRFSVDISINQLNGVAAGKMVNRYLGELPALRPLVLVVKSFLSQRSMNEVFTGGLGSYSIVCLCISFLQQHPKIRRGEIDPSKNLGVLVMEFFELYGVHFNYQDVGISLRDGGTYFNKSSRGWSDFRNSGLLSIEDPADISNDISRGSYGIARVRQTFAGAHSIMLASAFQRAETIRSRKSGRYTSFRSGITTPEEWSILASVMGVTQETINHRKLVEEVFNKRTLHRMAGVESEAERQAASHEHLNSRASSVKTAWEEVDGSSDSDHTSDSDVAGNAGHKRKRSSSDHDRRNGDEEESRYTITKDSRNPPSKRRRMGGALDQHTVFTTDSEDGEISSEDNDDFNKEYDAYAESAESEREEKRSPRPSLQRNDSHKRRSYWLSKGTDNHVDSD